MLRPEPSIHFCVIKGRAIFLDPAANRYFALPERANTAFVSAIGQLPIGIVNRAGLDRARNTDCGGGPFTLPPAQSCPKALSDRYAETSYSRPSTWLLLVALCAFTIARIAVKLLPMRAIFRTVRRREHAATDNPDRMVPIVGALDHVRRIAGGEGQCLPATLAFVWLSRLRGCNPVVVIGVRINPFSAHCWSQQGEIVLNDALDTVRLYQPIVVL